MRRAAGDSITRPRSTRNGASSVWSKRRSPATEQHRRDVQLELVDEAGPEVLLDQRSRRPQRDVEIVCSLPGGGECGLDPVGDERERGAP